MNLIKLDIKYINKSKQKTINKKEEEGKENNHNNISSVFFPTLISGLVDFSINQTV